MIKKALLFLLFSVSLSAYAQTGSAEGDWAYKHAKFEEAASFYQQIAETNTKDADAYANWALALKEVAKNKGDYDSYKEQIEQLLSRAEYLREGAGAYGLARFYSLLEHDSLSILWLERAINAAPINRKKIESESDFQFLHTKPTYISVLDMYFPKNKSSKSSVKNTHVASVYFQWATEEALEAEKDKDVGLLKRSIVKNEKVAQLDPNHYENYYSWGLALTKLGHRFNDENLYRLSFEKYAKAIALADLEGASVEGKEKQHLELSTSKYYDIWGVALSYLAKMKKDEALYQEASEKYARAVELNPYFTDSYYRWASALYAIYSLNKDESVCRQAYEKYEKVTELDAKFVNAYFKAGITLHDLAKIHADASLFEQSIAKFQKVVDLDPDSFEGYVNWGVSLLDLANLKGELPQYKEQIEQQLLKAEDLREGWGAYNLACLYSLLNETNTSLKWLEKALISDGNAFRREQIESDTDLNNLRQTPYYQELLDTYLSD